PCRRLVDSKEVLRMRRAALFTISLLAACSRTAATYQDCILAHVIPGMSNVATTEVVAACAAKFPVTTTPWEDPGLLKANRVRWDGDLLHFNLHNQHPQHTAA